VTFLFLFCSVGLVLIHEIGDCFFFEHIQKLNWSKFDAMEKGGQLMSQISGVSDNYLDDDFVPGGDVEGVDEDEWENDDDDFF